jgi:type II secretory pathway component PulF
MILLPLQIILGLILWLAPLFFAAWMVHFLVSLPMRRQESARFFLDLLEMGMKAGQSPEHAIIAAAQSRDVSMGPGFYLLACHLENGLRLGQALDRVPRLLPPQVSAILKAGEEIGDLPGVLPACRHLLKDGVSQARGALNYALLIALALAPLAPIVFMMLSVFVFPKFGAILQEMEVAPPAFTAWVMSHALMFSAVLTGVALALYAAAAGYIVGPWLAGWLRAQSFTIVDWLALQLPWRRKRMQRDFAAMLGLLLDNGVPEARAVSLSASATANAVFFERANRVVADLAAGTSLTEAVRRLDDTGEFRWRMANAGRSSGGFRAALNGWLESLDAQAFQQQQAAAHLVTTSLVLFNGTLVGCLVVSVFLALLSIINQAVLW